MRCYTFVILAAVLAVGRCTRARALDDRSRAALARIGARAAFDPPSLDSIAGYSPNLTQCSDGTETRRYVLGEDSIVVVVLGGRRIVTARLVALIQR